MKKIRTRRFSRRRKDENNKFFSNKENSAPEATTKSGFFQAKLEIGDPSDPAEKEADMVADAVVKRPNSSSRKSDSGKQSIQRQKKKEEPAAKLIQRAEKEEEPKAKKIQKQEEEEPAAKLIQRAEKEEEPAAKLIQRAEKEEEPAAKLIQRKGEKEEEPVKAKLKSRNSRINMRVQSPNIQAKSKDASPKQVLEKMIQETKGMGMELPNDLREQLESELKTDLSKVRIHTGKKAEEMTAMIQAQAFTHGYDVYFNVGKYQPATTEGKHLLVHELTHVVQQKG